MAFERNELNIAMKKMFGAYRHQLSDIFSALGAGNESQMLGASMVAVAEGFALQYMVDPGAFSHDEVKAVITKAVRGRLNLETPDTHPA